MDIKEIKNTAIWSLYEKGRNYHRMTSIYVDTDRNYRMYNGNQWEHAKLGDVEPVQKNFIKPIVKYKVGVIHNNLYAVNYSSQNFENKEFRQEAEKICEMLNKKAARIWEKDKMDYVGRKITKDAAINDEGIIYVNYDIEKQMPINEIVKKNDIYYGNENDEDIQGQPYILIRKRMPVANAMEMAREEGLSEDKLAFIIGDNDTFEESGEAAKLEIDNMVTVITKMWKEKGTVHFSVATRWIDIKKDKDSGVAQEYYTGVVNDDDLTKRLEKAGVEFKQEIPDTTSAVAMNVILTFLPIAFFVGMIIWMTKRMSKGGGMMGIGKSNAKMYVEKQTGVTFKDVAGQDEAKESLQEVVDFLHNPGKYTSVGAKLPKGALLVFWRKQ